jgi:hypothetical protein
MPKIEIRKGRVVLLHPKAKRARRRRLEADDPVWEVAVQERHVRVYYVRAANSTEARRKVIDDDPLAKEGPSEFAESMESGTWDVDRIMGGHDQFDEWEREMRARIIDGRRTLRRQDENR